jgi:hypothetical protein
VGDGYALRVDLDVISQQGNPSSIKFILDIGGDPVTPQDIIVETDRGLSLNAPFKVSASIQLFSLETFLINGCRVFLSTNAGSIDVGLRALLVKRTSRGI